MSLLVSLYNRFVSRLILYKAALASAEKFHAMKINLLPKFLKIIVDNKGFLAETNRRLNTVMLIYLTVRLRYLLVARWRVYKEDYHAHMLAKSTF